jgi:hypothetical protein
MVGTDHAIYARQAAVSQLSAVRLSVGATASLILLDHAPAIACRAAEQFLFDAHSLTCGS